MLDNVLQEIGACLFAYVLNVFANVLKHAFNYVYSLMRRDAGQRNQVIAYQVHVEYDDHEHRALHVEGVRFREPPFQWHDVREHILRDAVLFKNFIKLFFSETGDY